MIKVLDKVTFTCQISVTRIAAVTHWAAFSLVHYNSTHDHYM